MLNLVMTQCVKEISNKILDCLQEHIWEDMYSYAYYPNKVYNNGSGQATFEFMNAFKFEGVKKSVTEISNKLFYDWQSMSRPSSANPWVHGNYYTGQDRRSILAELLNVKGIDGGNDWDGKDRNAFWDNTIKDIDSKFDGWAREVYNKLLK